MLALGTTTVEIKTGYGLERDSEIKILKAIERLDRALDTDLVPTFMAAHAIPPEFAKRPDAYVYLVIEEMLPRAVRWYRESHFSTSRIPFFMDVFCDTGAFNVAQSRRVLQAGKAHGMPVKAHVDEFSNLGGVAMALELDAVSLDHLDTIRTRDVSLIAQSKAIAVITPAVNLSLGSMTFADARTLIDAGAAVAFSTDFNPGSSPCLSIPLVMGLACRYCRVTPAEALNGVTINAAHAVGLGNRVGSIEVGKQADLLILDVDDYREIAYVLGGNPVAAVIKKGQVVPPVSARERRERQAPAWRVEYDQGLGMSRARLEPGAPRLQSRMMSDRLFIDGKSLTIEDVMRIARGAPDVPGVELTEGARASVELSSAAVAKLLETGTVAYGITTGFGAFKDRVIPREQVELLQRNIILSHAVGVGAPFDRATTRAIMLIRANTLSRGYSGIRLETLSLLLELLNRGIHPLIPEQGSLGASGDLAPLAHMSLVLIGEGEANVEAEQNARPASIALKAAGLSPIVLTAKEGLALTNGTSVMCAVGVLETHRAERLSRVADIAGCLSLEALNGTDLAFDERIHALRPFPRQLDCAAYLRRLLEGSDFTRKHDPSNVQDAYTLRCMPQVHGAARDAIAYARWAIEIELNAVTDNPLIFVDDQTGAIEVISGGNFHGEPIAIAMDYLAIGVSELGNISERRVMRLIDEASNTHVLPAFLTREGGLNSGFMLAQYTAAALATENKILSHPASVDTIPTSANVEDHVSMGCTAALKMRKINDNVERILAIELMAAAQAIDFRREDLRSGARLGRGTAPVYELIRSRIPFIGSDTLMYPHIESARRLIEENLIVEAVRAAIGG